MFALDVGSEITPQTIYVTVEASQDGIIPLAQGSGGPSVNRRLFGSPTQPSPHHKIRTTTTTVPLKGLTDDEDEATPKPRRRRRTSSGRPGTPAAATSATKGRKARNPTPKTTKKPREPRATSSNILHSETPALSRPSTPRRGPGRPPKRKLPDAPTGSGQSDLTGRSPKKRRGRRLQSLFPDDSALLSSADNESNELDIIGDAHQESLDPTQDAMSGPVVIDHDDAQEDRTEAEVHDEEGKDEHDMAIDISEAVVLEYDELAQKDRAENHRPLNSAQIAPPDQTFSLPRSEKPLVGASYAPFVDQDDRSDIESHISTDQMEAQYPPSELVHQRSLTGESDDLVSSRQISGRHAARFSDEDGSSRKRDDPESFTMIGIEFMPSAGQGRSYSISDPPEIGETTSFFINKTLDSLREEIAGSDDNDVDILVSRDQTPAESEPRTRNTNAPSSDDQIYSMHRSAVTSSRHKMEGHGNTTFSSGSVTGNNLMHVGRLSMSPEENLDDGSGWPGIDGTEFEDGSFSDIPEEALAAAEEWEESRPPSSRAGQDLATPAEESTAIEASHYAFRQADHMDDPSNSRPGSSQCTPSQVGANDDNDSHQRAAPRSTRSTGSRRASGQQTMQNSSPPHSIRSRSDSNRLLTPPDDKSSVATSPTSDAVAAIELAQDVGPDGIGSSPPEMPNFDEHVPSVLPSRRNSDTPANRRFLTMGQHIQERQPSAILPQPSHLGAQRPALSPVVRIGRTLQNILSDPPSPSTRSSVLGSPFKGSARNSSPLDGIAVDEALQSVALADESLPGLIPQYTTQPGQSAVQQSAKTWSMALAPLTHIKSLVSQGAQLFTSPHVTRPQSSDRLGPSSPSVSKRPESTRNPSFVDRMIQTSREGSAYSIRAESRDGTDDKNEHCRVVGRADNLFSHKSGTPLGSLLDEEGFNGCTRQPASLVTGWDGACDFLTDNDFDQSQFTATQESRRQSVESMGDARVILEEDKHYTSQDAIGHSELAGQSLIEKGAQFDGVPANEEQSEEDDIWTIEANRTASSPRYPEPPNETIDSFRKSGLSIDWRTRSTGSLRNSQSAPDPGLKLGGAHMNPSEDLEDYSLLELHSGTATQQLVKDAMLQGPKQTRRVDLSEFFSSSPNFLERQRRAKQAFLAKPSIAKPSASSARHTSPEGKSNLMEQAMRSSTMQSVSKPPSPATDVSDMTNHEPTSRTLLSVSAERNSRSSISQPPQQEHTPRHDAQLLESWALASHAPTSDPVSPGTPQETQPHLSLGSEDSRVGTPELRPLPGRAASPSKSCLRSPLKPKILGRVVDFTSSAISTTRPLQAQTGLENRISNMPTPQMSLPGSSSSGKENQDAKPNQISISLNHPEETPKVQQQQRQKIADSPLSQTRWSRRHWLFLDQLLQSYKWNPLGFQLLHSDTVMANPHKRPSSSLLGKQVTSQGDTLVLKQWHLDVIDSFKKKVGGWAEEVIAKRLFALIVGEKRRRLGIVPKRR